VSVVNPALLDVPYLPVAPLAPGGFAVPPGSAAEPLLAGDKEGAEAAIRAGAEADPVALAALLGARGRYQEAIDLLDGAGEPDDDIRKAVASANRASALIGLGRLEDAERAARTALRAGRRGRDPGAEAIGALALALTQLARGRAAAARSALGDAVRAFAVTGDVHRQVQCHHLLGEIAYSGEDPIRAGSHYRDALALARGAGMDAAVEHLTLLFEHR
jgi:tetratricopeptide (TPR) repeat protein